MVIERAELLAKEGAGDAFAAALAERGVPLLEGHVGCRSVKLGRGVENPEKFLLLVEWDSVQAHATATQTPRHAEFREVLAPFVAGGAAEHFVIG